MVLVPVIMFAWFWFWRSHGFTGGDSEYWERLIHGGVWLNKRQMLSFFVMQLAFRITHALFGWTAFIAMNLVSCLAGALAMLASWALLREREHAGWSFAIVATAGFTAMFCGNIESYAQPVAALLLHFLAIRRYQQRRWPLWTLSFTYSLALCFHMINMAALPALAALLAWQAKRRNISWRDAWLFALGASPALVLWWTVSVCSIGYGPLADSNNCIVPPMELLTKPWLVFTSPFLQLKQWFIVWNGGVAAILAIPAIIWAFRKPSENHFTIILTLYFLCFLAHWLAWKPDRGLYDWDLFSFPWVVAVFLYAWHAMELPWRSAGVGLALGCNMLLFAYRPAQYAQICERGYGTIEVHAAEGAEPRRVMLDERIYLAPENRYVLAGIHQIRSISNAAAESKFIRVVVMRAGERHVYRYDDQTIRLERIERK
ncbi:hypothetical protein JXA32_10625 [Candidatus Sumerlaeota bacterium]|nr:hypothetical protein [Candidatus Sumerlaeota bacterium]